VVRAADGGTAADGVFYPDELLDEEISFERVMAVKDIDNSSADRYTEGGRKIG
jgi:hypothetical protein